MLFWAIITNILLIAPNLISYSEAKRKIRPSSYREWNLDTEGVCSGTDNSRSVLLDENRVQQLQKQYENCTRVYGNLELTHIHHNLLNGTDPDQFFSFLDHIQQITGYLLIYDNSFEHITLKSLEIIWGDTQHDDIAAIHISNNEYLKYVNMPKLRSVERGQIVLSYNPYMCNWNSTVSYYEILGEESESRLLFKESFKLCEAGKIRCGKDCDNHCWGPDDNMCQIVYRGICPQTCSSGMCYRKGTNETRCCDDACAAGCLGEGKTSCIACAKLEQDSRCVDKCNGLTDYDRKLKMTVNHTRPRYTYDRYCVERCPGETLIQGEHCVVHCTNGYWHDPEKDTRICEKCPNGICPKTCELNEPIDSSNIKSLHNCTLIEGFIRILRHTFEDHRKWFKDSRPAQNISALTVEMLESLNKIKVVTEFVEIQAAEYSPTSLKFLKSLSTIEGRKLSDHYALSVSSNINLHELGLSSLHKISNGRVYIGKNSGLCYVDTLENHWKSIVQMNTNGSAPPVKIVKNRRPELCKAMNKVCDESCHQESGCWGRGQAMCVRCAHYKMEDECVNDCPKIGYFESAMNKCHKCHPQCLSCNGPTALNCTTCLNVELQQGAGKECIAECPITHYRQENVCLPCNAACYHFGCSGPNDFVGEYGCNKCMHAKTCPNCPQPFIKCLISYGRAKDVCRDNNLTNYFTISGNTYVEQFQCEECSSECLSCVGYGTLVQQHKCKCARYLTKTRNNNDYCTNVCHRNSFVIRMQTVDKIGECVKCHYLCEQSWGCFGETAANCSRCARAAIHVNGVQVCLERCPIDRRFQDEHKLCYSFDPAAYASARRRYMVLALIFFIAIFILVLAFITWKCLKYKKRYKEEIEMNAPDIPECKPIDPFAKPNMTRLCIITSENLIVTSRPLGKGAFGTVYAGYWWPKGRERGGEKVVVAIKVVHDPSGTAQQDMLEEAGIMASMRHENLLRLVGVCLTNGMQIVTPLRPLGSLRDFLIKHHQKLSARDLILYCYQISSAMEYLYKHHLVHRDLAARNVLVKRTNHVEVTDFGLAKLLDKGEDAITVGGKVAVKWLALESLQHRIYNHWTDVWAFGITCWEVLTFGQTPYQGISPEHIRDHLESGNRLQQPNNCSQEIYQTLLQCWLVNPDARPSFVIIREKFNSYCRAPNLYVLDHNQKQRMEMITNSDQRELINDLLEDNDFTDPMEYFDENQEQGTASTILPLSPISLSSHTPWPQPNLPTIRDRRGKSIDSSRYQSDPVQENRNEVSMDGDNYLVPNVRESPALLYTPVVLCQSGETELMKSAEYYNDKLNPDYYNHLKPVPEANNDEEDKATMASLENKNYFAETETSL